MNEAQDGSTSHIYASSRPSPYREAGDHFDYGSDSAISANGPNGQQYNSAFDPVVAFDQPVSFLSDQQGYSQMNVNDMVIQQGQLDNPAKQDNSSSYGLQCQLDQHEFESNLMDFGIYSQNNDINNNDGQQDMFSDPIYKSEPSPLQSVNPADLMSDRSSPFSQATSPPNRLTPDNLQQAFQFPQQSSPFTPSSFSRSSGHSRNVSLGPESAHFPHAQLPADWSMMQHSRFTTHRRSPSEYSVSSVSAIPSPNLLHLDSFDSNEHHSPLFQPQNTSAFPEGLELNNFSLNENSIQHIGMSASHQPSPHIGAQIPPIMTPQQQFLLGFGFTPDSRIFNTPIGDDMNEQYQPPPLKQEGSVEMGQAQQMIPPEINVEFAPASRQNSFEPPKTSINEDGLIPPDRGRNRRRAASDVTGTIRPPTPTCGSGAHLGVNHTAARSLSPGARSGTSSSRVNRRQSTSMLPNRDYILGLADPEHQSIAGTEAGSTKRVQRHPATFQCTLCPKKFTRAYNLRSHLRTHTDERPFICTVCGKAFARQHDRKRHEGLHSGEKKFVCKGELQHGDSWGCGRRFARADALGRHFRSEAGRVCIKPLLDEEAQERSRQWQEQQLQNMTQSMQPPQSIGYDAHGFPIDALGNYTLPAALLAQYPALATINWPELGHAGQDIEDDISGRSSFDASASDYYEENGEDGYLSAGGGHQDSLFQQPDLPQHYASGYKSDF